MPWGRETGKRVSWTRRIVSETASAIPRKGPPGRNSEPKGKRIRAKSARGRGAVAVAVVEGVADVAEVKGLRPPNRRRLPGPRASPWPARVHSRPLRASRRQPISTMAKKGTMTQRIVSTANCPRGRTRSASLWSEMYAITPGQGRVLEVRVGAVAEDAADREGTVGPRADGYATGEVAAGILPADGGSGGRHLAC